MNGVAKATDVVGSRRKLAAVLGVSTEAVRKWERGRVPAERCQAIVDATDGTVQLHDLRPDLWAAPRDERAVQVADQAA